MSSAATLAWQYRRRRSQRRIRLALVVGMVLVILATVIQIIVHWVWPVSAQLPETLSDNGQLLKREEKEQLVQEIETLDHQLQAKTHVILHHPLQAMPPYPLSHRGIWLAYDPSTKEVALQLGTGLQTPYQTVLLLNTPLQPFLNQQLQLIARQSLPPAQAVHLMLLMIVQHYHPKLAASQVHVPE